MTKIFFHLLHRFILFFSFRHLIPTVFFLFPLSCRFHT